MKKKNLKNAYSGTSETQNKEEVENGERLIFGQNKESEMQGKRMTGREIN